jgi:hypothetical protein
MRRQILQFGAVLAMMGAVLLSDFSGLAQSESSKFSGVWVTKKVITRKPKPNRASPPKAQQVTVRLLTIQWRVMKQNAEGKPVEVDPALPLYTGDRIQFAVKVNQNGYLYLIQNTEGDEGVTIFPDARVNGGKNYVKKDVEVVLPFNCEEEHKDENGNCWYRMEPPDGREDVTVIFSRDQIISLPNDSEEAKKFIKKQVVSSIKDSSPEPTRNDKPKGLGAGRFATWVTNTNVNDNEELVSTFYLTHSAPPKNN